VPGGTHRAIRSGRGGGQTMHTPFDITVRWCDGQRAIRLSGELSLATASAMRSLLEIVCAHGATEVELDLRDVTFIDSTGIGVIMMAKKACAARACGFFLIPSKVPQTVRMWEVSGLQDRLSWREGPSPSPSSTRED
jgi:anti-sigma B factor antagonist